MKIVRKWACQLAILACVATYVPLQLVLLEILKPRASRPIHPPLFRPSIIHSSSDHEAGTFIQGFQGFQGNRVQNVTTETLDSSSSIVYGFLVHNDETIEGLKDLLSLIWNPIDYFLIHVDAKVDPAAYNSTVQFFSNFSNIHLLNISYACSWGTVELLAAELALVKYATQVLKEEIPWSLFFLLDGTSYPLQTLSTIRDKLLGMGRMNQSAVFDESKGRVRTCSNALTSFLNVGICNFHKAHCISPWDCTKYERTPNHHVVWKGTQWVALARKFAEHVMSDHEALIEWPEFFGGSFGSDEMYFATVAMSVDWIRESLVPDHDTKLIFKIWSSFGCRTHKVLRGYGDSPCYLGKEDDQSVRKAIREGYIFARKFYSQEPYKVELID